jgi:hypothetical protein
MRNYLGRANLLSIELPAVLTCFPSSWLRVRLADNLQDSEFPRHQHQHYAVQV